MQRFMQVHGVDSFAFDIQPAPSIGETVVSKPIDATTPPLFNDHHSGGVNVLFGDGSVRQPDDLDLLASAPGEEVQSNLLLPYTDFDLA